MATIHKSLLGRDYTAYSTKGAENKKALHTKGMTFLRQLAQELGLEAGTYDVRSNKGGIAVSGEVTLHGESIYVQISDHCSHELHVLYRTCKGRKDYSGGQNHSMALARLANPEAIHRFVQELKKLAG